jgi:hypothetical protein
MVHPTLLQIMKDGQADKACRKAGRKAGKLANTNGIKRSSSCGTGGEVGE